VYDRHGAISAEKIPWSVDVLLELLLFALWMQVYWVVDMVVDRLHYLYSEQARCKDIYAEMGTPVDGYVDVGGRRILVGSKLFTGHNGNLLHGVAAEDFEEGFMSELANMRVSMPVWRFLADILYALGDDVRGALWFETVSEEVRYVSTHTEEKYLDATTTREAFCARYHHHSSDPGACYTSHRIHSATHNTNSLYASSSLQNQTSLSDGLDSGSSLANILYSRTGDVRKLKRDNSTRTMLEAEKMVLEMESRLYEAKHALQRAREASEGEKKAATDEASRVVRSMCSHESSTK
jgi:hypothetical protein